MKPGRELDQLIAKKVFGLDLPISFSYFPGDPPSGPVSLCPFYSTEIAAAWEVVAKLSPYSVSIEMGNSNNCFSGWRVWLGVDQDGDLMGYEGHGETAPHAICLAALKAAGVSTNQDQVNS